MKQILLQFDTRLTHIITSWPSQLHGFFLLITALGDPIVTVGIGVVVMASGFMKSNPRLILAGATVPATLLAGSFFKVLFERARPLTEYAANLRLDTYSFPSGHTSGATIAYGLLAFVAWQVLPQPFSSIAVALLCILIIAIGISRVYLGAHFPSDVVAGWLLGLIGLAIIILVVKPRL